MNEDNMNLNELEELKKSYHLMDEKLEGQEFVTPEQIRAVIVSKVKLLKFGMMKDVITFYVAVPLLLIFNNSRSGLSNLAFWIMGIYSLVAIGLYLLLFVKVSRKDFMGLDLNTLMHREIRDRRIYLLFLVMTSVFWVVFAFVFKGVSNAITLIIIFLLIYAARYPILVRKLKPGPQEKYNKTPTIFVSIVTIALFIIGMLIFIVFYILDMIA